MFSSNQQLTSEGGDLNCLGNEACYLMMSIHQKYLLIQVNYDNDHIQHFIDPFQIKSDQVDDNASKVSSQVMSDDSSEDDNDSSWLPEEDDCSENIDDDEESNNHDNVENTSTNHVDHVGDDIFVQATPNFSMRDASVLEDTNKLLSPGDIIKNRLRHIREKTKILDNCYAF
jgi:hypothetical protein